MKKRSGLSVGERMLDWWRGVYSIVIPTVISGIYFILSILIFLRKIEWRYLWESVNYSDSLSVLVTFISIILSFFGILIPLLISGKSTSETIKYFFSVVDKKYFLNRIKIMIISGFLTILLLALLYFNDLYYDMVNLILSTGMLWVLLYFVASAYRLICIMLMMFLYEKKNGYKGEE